MKRSEIKLGKVYSNKKGTARQIVGEGPFFLYVGQKDKDCVRYVILTTPYQSNLYSEANCTKQTFASWAKEEITDSKVLRTLAIS